MNLTYESRNGKIVVHKWGKYARHSVLAGQSKKTFVGSFDTVEEALTEHPEAQSSHPMIQPQNTFDHLPDDADY